MTSSPFIVPVYHAPSVAGIVLGTDEQGRPTHPTVTDTTAAGIVQETYVSTCTVNGPLM